MESIIPSNGRKLHIAMFPWLAFGHLIPFLELAKLIAQKGHQISFISTPQNVHRLPKLPPNLTPLINFVQIPLPAVENLPDGAEATIDVPYDKVKYLKIAYDGLQEPITKFLHYSSPDWIIFDFASYWVGPVASELEVSSAFFSIFTAAFMGFCGPAEILKGTVEGRTKPEDFIVKPNWVPFESRVAFRLFEILRVFDGVTGDEDNVSDGLRMGCTIEGCDLIIIRSCYEFESDWLRVIEEIHRKPLIPVGQLPTTVYDGGDVDKDGAWREIKDWFDQQEKGSVVYVAFGSEAKPSQTELTEIALGLEVSGLPFFWVLRKQRGSADIELTQLPEGFEGRTRGRGIVCTTWAPQLKILNHVSVGGFLTHSGWSSVVEAISLEKALILLTFLADQGPNARLLEEKKMGYSVPRDERDGSFSRDSVADALRLVMASEEGKIYRDKVKEMKWAFGDRDLQDRYVHNLLGYLQTHNRKKGR